MSRDRSCTYFKIEEAHSMNPYSFKGVDIWMVVVNPLNILSGTNLFSNQGGTTSHSSLLYNLPIGWIGTKTTQVSGVYDFQAGNAKYGLTK